MQNSRENATSLGYFEAQPLLHVAPIGHFSHNLLANSTKFYLSVYAGITGATLIFTVSRSVLFAYAGLQAAARIHEHMLDAVLEVCTNS